LRSRTTSASVGSGGWARRNGGGPWPT
jgi:hypothetical protein